MIGFVERLHKRKDTLMFILLGKREVYNYICCEMEIDHRLFYRPVISGTNAKAFAVDLPSVGNRTQKEKTSPPEPILMCL